MLVVCLLFCFAVVAKSGPGLVAVDPRSLGSSNRCDPSTQSGTKRPHPNQNTAYFYCNIDGFLLYLFNNEVAFLFIACIF
jgi:hypothetical protein